MGCTNLKFNIQGQALASHDFQSSKFIKNFLTFFSKFTVHEQKLSVTKVSKSFGCPSASDFL